MKSLLSGGIFGGVIAVVGAGVISVIAPPPASNVAPDEPMISVSEVQEQEIVGESVVAVAETDDGIVSLEAPAVAAPNDAGEGLVADTEPLESPTAEVVQPDLSVPEESATPEIVTSAEDPVLPNPQSLAPQAPATEQSLNVDTAPAEPLPQITQTEVETPETVPAEQEIEENTTPEEETVIAEEPEATDLVAPNEEVDDAPIVVAIIGDDQRSLPGANSGVKVNRIAGPEGPSSSEDATTPAVGDSSSPAIVRYAAQFENTNDRPAMSVILLHQEGQSGGPEMVASLTFPVTVVIDSSAADAEAMLAAYTDVGAEIAFSTEFPRRATPADVEVVMAAAVEILPRTVAMVDTGGGSLQSDRNVTRQAVAALASDGRGLVTVSKGLNSALRAAESEGVPAGVIYRDLDGDGQDARVIRRFLDQAAFRARQDDGVILLARMRQETIDALDAWSAANENGQVALAPLSQILTAQ